MSSPTSNAPAGEDQCPVDHKARQAWLSNPFTQSSQNRNSQPTQPQSQSQSQTQTQPKAPLPASCDSISMSQSNTPAAQKAAAAASSLSPRRNLSQDREISTIPRSNTTHSGDSSSPNAQSSNPETSSSGNWVYPSEAQFFAAMARKNYNPQARDMSSIIPIHNAVNERTWKEILDWERGKGGEKCGGPKLVSFSGDSTKLTPRARWYGLLGYQKPFDRHDWVVERCGTRVEYVIDYYQGKEGGGSKGPSFYLDVRPKLNSFEGWRMRALKTLGL